MSETYTKLFQSILRSSIWLEDDQTLRVWVAMLALADQHGYVGASVGGLASQARVSKEKVQEALDKFLSPDEDSRSHEYEGRRIEVAERGWNLLNYQRFRDMRDEDTRRQYERDRKREQRSRKSPTVPKSPGHGETFPDCHEMSAKAEAEAEADQKKEDLERHDAEGEAVHQPAASNPKQGAKAPRKRSAAGKEVPIPVPFVPTEKHIAFCQEHKLDLNLEVTSLLGWAEGRTQISWNGTFTTRLTNSVKWRKEKPATSNGAPYGGTRAGDLLGRQMDRIARLEAVEQSERSLP